MTPDAGHSLQPSWWLARIPEIFAAWKGDLAPASVAKDGEGDYHRLATAGAGLPIVPELRMFYRWFLPVHHAWPCNPEKTQSFIEKSATAIASEFSPHSPRAVMTAAFEPHARHGYFRKLASNLRGRTLQLMPGATSDADALGPDDPVVYALVGRTGLFCGLQTPCSTNGFHPGGTRFIRQSGDEVLSRAGAKIVEALHHMRLLCEPPPQGAHWLELGACPGGMTSELLRHHYHVTAIDRAPLDRALVGAKGLRFFHTDVVRWRPPGLQRFDALLCDMNGTADEAFGQVVRLSKFLQPAAPIVFTLKMTGAEKVSDIIELHHRILAAADAAGLTHLQTTHLTYNRREFTMFLATDTSSSKRFSLASQDLSH